MLLSPSSLVYLSLAFCPTTLHVTQVGGISNNQNLQDAVDQAAVQLMSATGNWLEVRLRSYTGLSVCLL